MENKEKKIFEHLNKVLEENDLSLTVICAGGFVLSYYGIRATHDIDGFYDTSTKIEKLVKQVGDHFDINTEEELWLNNSIQSMNEKPDESICETIYNFSNLKVLIPPLEYIAGMKLYSAREQDIDDVASIIKLKNIKEPKELDSILQNYKFTNIDESLLLEAFGRAYGMDWLQEYYVKNEEDILSRL